MKQHKTTDYANFAGYIDGDGCFYIGFQRSKIRLSLKPQVLIKITSTNERTLQHFKKMFGGSVCLMTKAHNNSKALYQYTARKRALLNFINKIYPYLVEKKEEAMLALKFSQSTDKSFQKECIYKMKILKDTANLVSKHHVDIFKKSKQTIQPTQEDFAYLAGFIDAECCLSIGKWMPKNKPNYVYKIILSCNNTKAPVFKWLLERFGGFTHFIDRSKYKIRNQLSWRLTSKALSKILDKIYPFLKYKKPVCNELMKFYATTLPNGGARHTEVFRSQYAEVLKIRESIIAKVHKLNSKGIIS